MGQQLGPDSWSQGGRFTVIVVCGVPRSGTSMLMQMCRAALGEEFIMGEKMMTTTETKTGDWNPGGFWECRATRWGLKSVPIHRGLVKMLPVGLMRTKPDLIRKVIHITRDEKAVLRSVERLKIGNEYRTQRLMWDEWVERNPLIPVVEVKYEKILEDPETTCDFFSLVFGFGAWDRAVGVPKKELNRCGQPAP